MKSIFLPLFVLCLAAAGQAFAGNQAMLEQHAQELVQIRDRILDEIPNLPKNGRVRLSADVVERDGQQVIVINRLEKGDVNGDDAFTEHPKDETLDIPIGKGDQEKTTEESQPISEAERHESEMKGVQTEIRRMQTRLETCEVRCFKSIGEAKESMDANKEIELVAVFSRKR